MKFVIALIAVLTTPFALATVSETPFTPPAATTVGEYVVQPDDCTGFLQMVEGFVMARDKGGSRGGMYLQLMQPDLLNRPGYRAMVPVMLMAINDIALSPTMDKKAAHAKFDELCNKAVGKPIPYYQ